VSQKILGDNRQSRDYHRRARVHERDQPPISLFGIGAGTDQFGDMADRSIGLPHVDLPPLALKAARSVLWSARAAPSPSKRLAGLALLCGARNPARLIWERTIKVVLLMIAKREALDHGDQLTVTGADNGYETTAVPR
jgi:hypothetical protein